MGDFVSRSTREDAFSELEHLVTQTGDYLQVSADLRPLILETSRSRAKRASIRRWCCYLVAAASLYVVVLPNFSGDLHPTAIVINIEIPFAEAVSVLPVNEDNHMESEWRFVYRYCQIQERRRRAFRNGL